MIDIGPGNTVRCRVRKAELAGLSELQVFVVHAGDREEDPSSVGIDVANATVMTILDADRLGLSQLHQLRGRISRGTQAGFVCAIVSKACNPGDNDRLKAFEASDDGFYLAEMDLKLRGPGDLLGTQQHGLAPLRVADLATDGDLVTLAREVAREILAESPDLTDPALVKLVRQTLSRYGKSMQLSDIG